MDWTNSRRDASDVDYAVETERNIRDHPNSQQVWAALLGAVDAIPGGGGRDMYARARTNYPITYRAAQAAALAPVVGLAPKVGLPWAALTVANDPIVQRYYNDNIAPRPIYRDNVAPRPTTGGLAEFLQQGGQ